MVAALAFGACGTEGIQLSEDDPDYEGAVLFAERCSGCHTLDAAGTEGSANRALRNQGPNLNERIESPEDVLYAIQNGGFSGAIMPQNIVVGDEAQAVADFVAAYAGSEVDRPPEPGDASEIESEEQQAAAEGE
jgi:mono/diheme cytochrome c family protein